MQNPNHNPTSKSSLPIFSLPLNTPLVITAITVGSGIALHFLAGGNFGGFFGGGGGGSGGPGGSGGGSFWSRFRSHFVANAKEDDESESAEWDPHGLSGNLILPLNKLSGFKRYKVSEVDVVDWLTSEIDHSFSDVASIRPNGIYTKAQLKKELENLASCGMFERVDIESRTKPDGTIGVVINFVEASWDAKNRFKCINVGLMPPTMSIDKDPMQMSDRERVEFMRNQERDYQRKMEMARSCMLPESVHKEVLDMCKDG